jgi:NADPH-dependent 2,4-dienoyl-CoA reductase/sulfur reductase-like enzyme
LRENERLVIVGGGPSGLTTARAYREAGGRGRVTILTAENTSPYRRPPLTKEYLRGEIPRDDLPIQPNAWFEENGIELKLSTEVTSLDAENKLVTTGDEELSYDVCVLATGSEPVRPPIPGGDNPQVMVMRTVEDSTRLQDRLSTGGRIIVVGSGFIGCEASASLAIRGAEVAMISRDSVPQASLLGEEAGERILSWLQGYGVETHFGVSVEEVKQLEDGLSVRTNGESISGDSVLFGVGVESRTQLAEAAGLEVESGGIVTDTPMQTSVPGVFAVGDISFAYNENAGRHLHVEHWGEALNHGRVAGTVIAGGEAAWDVAPGFWSTIGDKTLKYVAWGDGWDEARLTDHGDGAFTVRYGLEGVCVGVLTHNRDADYENGRELVEMGASLP